MSDADKPNPAPNPELELATAINELENLLTEQDIVTSNNGREAYLTAHMDLCNALIAQALVKHDKAKAAEAAAAKPASSDTPQPLKPTGGSNA